MIFQRFPKLWKKKKRPISMVKDNVFKGWSSPLHHLRNPDRSSIGHVFSKTISTSPPLAVDTSGGSCELLSPHVVFGSTWPSRSFSSLSLPPWGVEGWRRLHAQPMQDQKGWHWVGVGAIHRLKITLVMVKWERCWINDGIICLIKHSCWIFTGCK